MTSLAARCLVGLVALSLAVEVEAAPTKATATRAAAELPRFLGPLASEEALCAAIAERHRAGGRLDPCVGCKTSCMDKSLSRVNDGLPPPMAEAVVFISEAHEEAPSPPSDGFRYGTAFLNLAARIGGEWFVATLYECQANDRWSCSLTLKEFSHVGDGVWLTHFETEESHRNLDSTKRFVTLIKVRDGRPIVMHPVEVYSHESWRPTKPDWDPPARERQITWKAERDGIVTTQAVVTKRTGHPNEKPPSPRMERTTHRYKFE